MTVKELRELLILPEGISQEDFENLEILVANSEETDALNPTRVEDSGYVVFEGKCDEKGNPLKLEEGEKDEVPAFMISI